MKLRIKNTYMILMLKHHWPYLFSFVFFIVLIIIVLPLQINKYLSLKDTLEATEQDLIRLENRKKKILSYDGIDLDREVNTLSNIFPDKPDRFSLFKNVSLLEEPNELLIQNFSSPFSDSEDDEIGINVRTFATTTGFRNLLANYFYKTGKLATIDSIFYDTETQDLTFTIFFHSNHVSSDEGILLKKDDAMFAQIQEIRKTLAGLGIEGNTSFAGTDDTTVDDYTSKQDPFRN